MNDIGDLGAEQLSKALAENTTLETLDIGGNNIRAMGMLVRVFQRGSSQSAHPRAYLTRGFESIVWSRQQARGRRYGGCGLRETVFHVYRFACPPC